MRAALLPIVLVALTGLQGCGGAVIVYDGARQSSTRVIGKTLAETSPGIDQGKGAKCITSAMSITEIIALGGSDSTRVTPRYRTTVAEVQTRPGVADCLAAVPRA